MSQTVPFKNRTAVIGVKLQVCNAACSGSGYTSTGPMRRSMWSP